MATTQKTPSNVLPKAIFSVEVTNHELLKLAYDSYLAQARTSSATTKQRGEVRGGGKKPWRQKGTGRARFGSSRNPIWRGGGVVFGPRGNENYSKKLSTGSKRVALRQALSLAHKAGKVMVAEAKTTGKTKDMADFLTGYKLARKVLIVVDKKTPELIRSSRNIQNVHVVSATYLNVYHILNADMIVLSPASITSIEAWLKKSSQSAQDREVKL